MQKYASFQAFLFSLPILYEIVFKMASVSRIFTRMFQRRSFTTASASGLGAEMLAEEVHAAGLCVIYTAIGRLLFQKFRHKIDCF